MSKDSVLHTATACAGSGGHNMRSQHIFAFTDGACSKNGKPGARASYASIVTTGKDLLKNRSNCIMSSGLVADQPYRLVDAGAPERGVAACEEETIAASNNRGELLGIISALTVILGQIDMSAPAAPTAPAAPAALATPTSLYEIVSDSRISIMTLVEWLPKRRATNTTHKLKNMDLLTIAEAMLARAREFVRVEFVHVNSHRPAPAADASAREHVLWLGNMLTDSLATSALN